MCLVSVQFRTPKSLECGGDQEILLVLVFGLWPQPAVPVPVTESVILIVTSP